jgi:hypothetical protein
LEQLGNISLAKDVSDSEDINLNDTVKNKVNLRVKVTEDMEEVRKNNETKESNYYVI